MRDITMPERSINLCPIYKAEILPDEKNRCSLCSAPNLHDNPDDYDLYYTGNFEQGLQAVVDSGRAFHMRVEHGVYTVELVDRFSASGGVAEWGKGDTVTEAARYAIGAWSA